MEQKDALINLEVELRNICETKVGRRQLITYAPLLLAGCATTSDRHREGDNTGQATGLTVAQEQQMTREYMPKMLKEYPPTKNEYAQTYIKNLGRKIATENKLEGAPYNYNFTLVDAKMVNAFALPAGEIFVTTPLLRMAKTEAELAGVVGHEIGHVKARHSAERIAKAKRETTKSILFGAIGAVAGGAAGYALGKKLCKKDDKECIRRIALYGGLAGAGGGLLIQKFAFMANSREDEMEADRVGFKTAMNSGFHSGYVGNFYSSLLEMEKKHKKGGNKIMAAFSDALSTHPPSEERVAQQREMSRQFAGRGKIISRPEFKKAKKLV